MKKVVCFVTLLMPVLASGGNFPGGNQQDMQIMMQKAQEMQACMQNIDQVKMQAFQQRAQQLGAEIKALCAAGKRSEAVAKAMVFSREMVADSSIQEMKKCGEMMKGFMPDLTNIAETYVDDGSKGHLCDN